MLAKYLYWKAKEEAIFSENDIYANHKYIFNWVAADKVNVI